MAKKPKGKTRKDAATVNILAVKRPATGVDIAEGTLPKSPYITQDQLADWLGVEAGDLDGGPLSEQQLAVGLALQARMRKNATFETGQFITILMSELASHLYDGGYAPTKDNPVYAIETFLAYRQARLYPPSWVLEWLATAFDGYINSEGKADLSKLLGVKRGKGKTLAFKEANSTSREGELMKEMGLLTVLRATIMEAAEMVSARQEETDPDCLSPDTLAERYTKKGWSKMFKQVKAMSPSLSPEDAKETFAAYPQHSVPTKFK